MPLPVPFAFPEVRKPKPVADEQVIRALELMNGITGTDGTPIQPFTLRKHNTSKLDNRYTAISYVTGQPVAPWVGCKYNYSKKTTLAEANRIMPDGIPDDVARRIETGSAPKQATTGRMRTATGFRVFRYSLAATHAASLAFGLHLGLHTLLFFLAVIAVPVWLCVGSLLHYNRQESSGFYHN